MVLLGLVEDELVVCAAPGRQPFRPVPSRSKRRNLLGQLGFSGIEQFLHLGAAEQRAPALHPATLTAELTYVRACEYSKRTSVARLVCTKDRA